MLSRGYCAGEVLLLFREPNAEDGWIVSKDSVAGGREAWKRSMFRGTSAGNAEQLGHREQERLSEDSGWVVDVKKWGLTRNGLKGDWGGWERWCGWSLMRLVAV